jgi:aryl-alcohol dehydrogenase-like predicted oxidoreductase
MDSRTHQDEENSMEYTRLGSSGLKVSRIALGCMSFGDTSRGFSQWALGDDAAEPIFRQALDLGITFWDTANAYGFGSSEEIVGRAITKYSRREDIVLATKVFFPMYDGPGGSGLSRRAIMEQVDASLKRLGTDYIDLYQIHRFDPDTPVEETMEALHDVVKAGKVRYLGASSMWAWQFAKMQHAADLHGWTRFVSMQNQYSLLQREEEREMFGLLADQGVGSIPWSPLAKGRLARPWGEQTERSESDPVGQRYVSDDNPPIVEAVEQVATARGIPMAQVALAWVLHHPVVSAPIVGPTKEHHLADAVAALDVHLTDEEIATLEAPYTPREPSGY